MLPFVPATQLNLTNIEIKLIKEYSDGESLWINNYFRSRQMDELSEEQRIKLKNSAVTLNNIIKKSPRSTKETIVYRGAEAMHSHWKNINENQELEFTNKGLISTSFSKEAALNFLEDDEDCCLLILKLPKNTIGLYISQLSSFNVFNEDELLLPHESKFLVTKRGVTQHNSREIITYWANLVSQKNQFDTTVRYPDLSPKRRLTTKISPKDYNLAKRIRGIRSS
jgi:predicted GIY-YIG superfamily endonuclease